MGVGVSGIKADTGGTLGFSVPNWGVLGTVLVSGMMVAIPYHPAPCHRALAMP